MLSNSGHDENNKYNGGVAGDQNGDEWELTGWYSRPWNYMLRYPNRTVANMIATLAKSAALNDNIGYDQNERLTFWEALRKANYDPANITTKCEADCSAGVAAIVKATGYKLGIGELMNVPADMYTGNEKDVLAAAGFKVYSASKYLTSDNYLLPGDILLQPGNHTAINLTTGRLEDNTEGGTYNNVGRGQVWLNQNYGNFLKQTFGEVLVVDGIYGTKSRNAALAVWKDLMNRKYGTSLTPSNPNFGPSCEKVANNALVKYKSTGTFTFICEFLLSAKNYYYGDIDALCGDQLCEAIQKFERDNGLTVDSANPLECACGKEVWKLLFN